MDRGLLIREIPKNARPREKLVMQGADKLDKTDLIAILLRTGTKGVSVLDVAQQLLSRFGTLDKLSRATIADLRKIKGIGRDKAVTLVAAFNLAQRMANEILHESAAPPMLDTPDRVAELLRGI